MTNLKASVRIGSYSTNAAGASGDGSGVRIEVTDALSGTRVLLLDMSHAEFGRAVAGRGGECDMELTPQQAGKRHENKTERVTRPGSLRPTTAQIRKALRPYEVDGWVGSDDDLLNPHRSNGDGTYKVTFHRYVSPSCSVDDGARGR